jgi:cell filamentation protein
LHRQWLGSIYSFAGQIRTVDMAKDLVTFCPAANLNSQLQIFEGEVLTQHTPCEGMQLEGLAMALAVVHVDFILIHPFREGNGRLGRWIATLMALQAGRPLLDFSHETTEEGRNRYFAALRRGFAGDIAPAYNLFCEILRRP